MQRVEDLLKQVSIDKELDEGFETAVFGKIRRRKVHRRLAMATSVVFVIVGFLFSFYLFMPRAPQQAPLTADSQLNDSSQIVEKEEVPVLEDVYFSSYDDRTHYAVELVSYTQDEGGI
jgi:cytoskeletal protein RodZ